MSNHSTAEEAKQKYLKIMGDELGPLYYELRNELVWLYIQWGEYEQLFGTKLSRVELLNKAAGLLFLIVQGSLWESTFLHICRLTDPPRSARKDNLTIQKLADMIPDENLKKEVTELIKLAKEKTEFCREWRNRHIAHRDYSLVMNPSSEPLTPTNRDMVKKALGSISNVLNAILYHYEKSTEIYDNSIVTNNAVTLLYVLDDGLRAEEERNQRKQSGNYRSEDFEDRDL